MKENQKHKIIGVVEFISYDEYLKHGYIDEIPDYPVLEYKRIGVDTATFWRPEGFEQEYPNQGLAYKVIYDHMVKKRYTLDEAREKFPELFL